MPGRPMSSRTTSGWNRPALAGRRRRRGRVRPRGRCSFKQACQALGGVDVVVDDQDAAGRPARAARRRGPAPGRRGGPVAGRGRRTTNSLPWPGPSLCGLDRPAVHLDQPPHERQADAQPALRPVERAVRLREQVEHARQHVRRDADAGVADADDAPAPSVSRSALSQMRPPGVGVLGRVVEQVGEHLGQPGRVAVHPDRLGGKLDRQAGGRGRRSAAGWPRRPAATTAARSTGSIRRRILPRVMRRHVEQVVHQADQVRHLAVDHVAGPSRSRPACVGPSAGAPRRRCGSGRAGCAARGRASTGTRSSAGRPPGRRR